MLRPEPKTQNFLDNVNNLPTSDSDLVDSDEEKQVLSNIRYLSRFYTFTIGAFISGSVAPSRICNDPSRIYIRDVDKLTVVKVYKHENLQFCHDRLFNL